MISKTTKFVYAKRVLCLAIALFLMLPLPGEAATKHGFVLRDKVLLRQATSGSDYWAYLNTGWVVEILDLITSNGYDWYKVKAADPGNLNRVYEGYIRSDMLRPMTATEQAAWLANPVQGAISMGGTVTVAPSTSALSTLYAIVTVDGANLRQTAAPTAVSVTAMLAGTMLNITGPAVNNWLPVTYASKSFSGFVSLEHIRYLTIQEEALYKAGNTITVTGTTPPSTTPVVTGGYVKTNKHNVNLRQTPNGNSTSQIPINTVLKFTDPPVLSGGYSWMMVNYNTAWGYIRGDCYDFCDVTGHLVPPPAFATTAPSLNPGGGAVGSLQLIRGGVNLRKEPNGAVIGSLDRGVTVNYYGFTQVQGYTWYYIMYSTGSGYIRGDMVRLLSGAPTVTTPPTVPGGASAYIITTRNKVNLRKTPGGASIAQVLKAKVYALTGPIVSRGGYSWYFVKTDSNTGYLRSDCVRQLNDAEVKNYLAGIYPSITPPATSLPPTTGGAAAAHVIITGDKINIRTAPSFSSRVAGVVSINTVLPYKTSVYSGGKSWMKVTYNNADAYVVGTFARIMTLAEYNAWLGTTATTPPAATPAPKPEDMSTVALTRTTRVLVRKGASSSASTLTVLYKEGTVANLLGPTATADGYTWLSVKTSGVEGWIRSDLLRILTKKEASAFTSTGNPNAPVEATYRKLNLGMTGPDVTRLQDELIRLKFLAAGNANGTYTTLTQDAVREYQKAAGIFVDGIAGESTQHKMFNTVPEGSYGGTGGSTTDVTLYPVEKVDWYAGDISTFWAKGETATVTDVNTGLSFRAKRWSGGYHVDAEPLTAADTATYCKIYGVSDAQMISEKNYYQRRPLWITLKGRSFAASQYGVPHNYPAGDTIPDNNFNGQFCIHFYNSRTHTSGRVDADHMKAIQTAYDKAPQKK